MINATTGLLLSAALFSIGLYGVMTRRALLTLLMSVELMRNAANLAFVVLARTHGEAAGHDGHVFVLVSIGVAAAEAAVGLAFLIAVFHRRGTADAGELRDLRG